MVKLVVELDYKDKFGLQEYGDLEWFLCELCNVQNMATMLLLDT